MFKEIEPKENYDIKALLLYYHGLYYHGLYTGAQSLNLQGIERFATAKHAHQVRKDGSPYINHPRDVSRIAGDLAAAAGQDPYGVHVTQAVGLLHDCIEDQGADFEDIVKVANAEVAVLVSFLSDDKRLPSAIRHHGYLERLSQAPLRAQLVKLADIVDNGHDAALALDLTNVTRQIVTQNPHLVGASINVLVQQQLITNKEIMGRWARKAEDIVRVLTLVSKLDVYDETTTHLTSILGKTR